MFLNRTCLPKLQQTSNVNAVAPDAVADAGDGPAEVLADDVIHGDEFACATEVIAEGSTVRNSRIGPKRISSLNMIAGKAPARTASRCSSTEDVWPVTSAAVDYHSNVRGPTGLPV